MKWSPPSALTVHELYKSPLTLWHGAFLKPVSSLENVNKRQGNISSLEACTQTTETSWTGRLAHGEGKLSLGGLSQDHAGIISRMEFPFIPEQRAKDPMPRMASGSSYSCMSPVRLDQPRTRLGPSPVAWASLPRHPVAGGPWACGRPQPGSHLSWLVPRRSSNQLESGGLRGASHTGHLGFTVEGAETSR